MMYGLYESDDLLRGYDPRTPETFIQSWDYQTYIAWVKAGGSSPIPRAEAIRQAEHDVDISAGVREFLGAQDLPTDKEGDSEKAPRMVAFMGGHGLDRGTDAFKLAADIARDLTSGGYLVVSGGGPGAMEASHFGAYFANAPKTVHDCAMEKLADCATLPISLGNIIDPKTGAIIPGQQQAYIDASNWLNAALDAKAMLPNTVVPGKSLAIPTWLYGTEPTTPFATVYAKYFQNSLREETLVAEGKAGTIYAQGSGGTLREVFQGIEHNCYVKSAADFIPMIFVDPKNYWQTTASYDSGGKAVVRGVNLADIVPSILKLSLRGLWDQCAGKIQFTTRLEDVRGALDAHAPVAQAKLLRLLRGEPVNLESARFSKR